MIKLPQFNQFTYPVEVRLVNDLAKDHLASEYSSQFTAAPFSWRRFESSCDFFFDVNLNKIKQKSNVLLRIWMQDITRCFALNFTTCSPYQKMRKLNFILASWFCLGPSPCFHLRLENLYSVLLFYHVTHTLFTPSLHFVGIKFENHLAAIFDLGKSVAKKKIKRVSCDK